jgi:hypothetical protein
MSSERERRFVGPRRGQVFFAAAFVVLSLLLLVQIGWQTQWVEKAGLAAQPRFWPALSLGAMVLLGGLHLWRLPWHGMSRYDRWELRKWAAVLEYAGWFMGYVLLVPVIGYLPATVLFVPALSWRMGYRSGFMLGLGVVFAVFVVVLFKGFLSVRVPGGMIYEYLPGGLRNFFILYF